MVRGVDEAAQVVDVAVGVVAGDALAEPDRVARAEDARRRPARSPRARSRGCAPAPQGSSRHSSVARIVAGAVRRRWRRLRGHRPALPTARRSSSPRAFAARSGIRASLLVVRVLRPGVEAEARDRHLGRGAVPPHADGAEVAGPAAVGRACGGTRRRAVSAPTRSRTRRALRLLRRRCTRTRTVSPSASRRTISPYTHGIGAKRPASRATLCGQREPGRLVRLPLRGHAEASARGRGRARGHATLVEEALVDAAVGVDAPVAQERPVAAHLLDARAGSTSPIEDLLAVGRAPRRARRRTDRRGTSVPQNSRPGLALARARAHAVDRGDVDAVGDGVRALDGLPGVALGGAVLCLLGRVPADGGRVEEDRRAPQRGEPRAFGVPLVPADQRPDAARAQCRRPGSRGRPG